MFTTLFILAINLVVLFTEFEGWPLSHYPMFSPRILESSVRFHRIRVTTKDGRTELWNPPHKYIVRDHGLRLKYDLNRYAQDAKKSSEFFDRRTAVIWWQMSILGQTDNTAALEWVKRSVFFDSDRVSEIQEEVVMTYDLNDLNQLSGDYGLRPTL